MSRKNRRKVAPRLEMLEDRKLQTAGMLASVPIQPAPIGLLVPAVQKIREAAAR